MRTLLGETTVQNAESQISFHKTGDDIGVWWSAGMTSSASFRDGHVVEVLRTSSNHLEVDTDKPRDVMCRPRDLRVII